MRKMIALAAVYAWLGFVPDMSYEGCGLSLIGSAQAATPIEIYTASYCGECKRAKAYMQAHKIAFTEYDVEQDRNRLREFYQRGGRGIPLIFIGSEMMHGFEQQRFEELLAEPKNVPKKETNLATTIVPTIVPAAAVPGTNRQAQE